VIEIIRRASGVSSGLLHHPRRWRRWLLTLQGRLRRCSRLAPESTSRRKSLMVFSHRTIPSCIWHPAQRHHAGAPACL
jgi:hypothetical protein